MAVPGAVPLAVHGEPRGKDGVVLMMDDIDVGLHPGAQEKLVAALLQVAQHDLVQIFTTTHSPYVVDAAGPENTWVLGPGKDGRSVAGRLSDHPDAAKALQVLTAGEFWGSVGEEWLRTG